MILVIIKIIVLASLLAIFYQDQKDRLVYWWLFLVGAIGLSIVHISAVGWLQYGIHSAFNSGLVVLMLLVLIGYIKIRMQTFSLQNVLGIGDVFFLFALALGFATLSFITLLVFGLIFSLILHLVFQKFTLSRTCLAGRQERTKNVPMHKETTVPLAGYLSLFFAVVLLVNWLGFYDNLYVI